MQLGASKNLSISFRWLVAFLGVTAIALSGCATTPRTTAAEKKSAKKSAKHTPEDHSDEKTPDEEGVPDTLVEAGQTDASLSEHARAAQIEGQTMDQVIRASEPDSQSLYDNSRYDFPITVNARVEGWIDYFTGKGRHHMERYLGRSSRYIPLMRETLKKEGLPQDLVYLALIESGFNLRAKSRTRAVGAWQFMKPTGKRYGLRADAYIDERRDFEKSTVAAGRYLKDLYLMFESWYLAASAYNAGEYKILRGINTLKTKNYWTICGTNFLRRETRDYVPKLIAAAIIAKNPARYGFADVDYEEPMKFESIVVDKTVSLAEVAKLIDTPLEDMEDLNPELLRGIIPADAMPYQMRIPVGKRTLVERALSDVGARLVVNDKPRQHIVRAGETLRSVSQRYRLNVRTLANANNMSPKERISPGFALIIPGAGEIANVGRVEPVANATRREDRIPSPISDEGRFTTHVVRNGESLWTISEKYDVTVQQIFRWNNLKKSRIYPGKRLKIQTAGTEKASSSARTARRPSRRT